MKPHATFFDSQKHVLQTHSWIGAVPIFVWLLRFRLCVFLVLASAFSLKTVAQAPVITSFSPTSGAVGTTVTISGSNFNANAADNIVYFGAVRAIVTAATSTSLLVTVPRGATYEPISVTTNNFTGYSTLPFTVTFSCTDAGISSHTFAPKVDFPTGANPSDVAISDLDGDGKPDLAVANNGLKTISVFRNNSTSGTITFASKVDFPVGLSLPPAKIDNADLDGDGKPDLVVTYGGAVISVFRNTSTPGTPAFALPVHLSMGRNDALDFAISDLDSDGKPDLVATNRISGSFAVFRNTSTPGTLSFDPRVDFSIGNSFYRLGITATDLDGDGKPDLAVANYVSGNVSLFRNVSTSGAIAFAPKVDFPSATNPQDVAFSDLDGDGKLDLIVITGSGSSSAFRNTSTPGTLSFDPRVDFPNGGDATRIAISDLDGDGKPDLAIANSGSTAVSAFRNTSTPGTLSFDPRVEFPAGSNTVGVAISDLDGDGKPDLTVANYSSNSVSVLKNQIACPTICIPPTFTVAVSDASCGGRDGSITLTPTSASTICCYSLDGGTTYVSGPASGYTFAGLSPGIYQFRIKDINGCESASIQTEVKEDCSNTCEPTFINNGTIVRNPTCGSSDGAIYLIPTSGTAPFYYSINGGQTYYFGPATGYTFEGVSTGTYQLRVRDGNGCESKVATRVLEPIDCPGIINQHPSAKDVPVLAGKTALQAYPNPSNGVFRVQVGGLSSENVHLLILDAKGTVIQQKKVGAGKGSTIEVNLSGKAKGLYLLKVTSEKGILQTKLLLQ